MTDLRATAHPLRLRMLSLLTGSALSAAELARELDITQANASYHLRLLARAELVEVSATESVRGGKAKKYRYRYPEHRASGGAARRGRAEAEAVERRQYLEVMHSELLRRSEHRVDGPSISTDAEVWLTAQTWQRARSLVHEASQLVHEGALRPHAAGTVHVNFQAELFELRDPRDDQDGDDQGGVS